MSVKKININQQESSYYIASDIYDVSSHNNGATFESLSALLSDKNLSTLIPSAIRCGGMSIRFIQSSCNKYMQYRLMSNVWSTTVADWQGVDDEPITRSNNLVKSGCVYDKFIYNPSSKNLFNIDDFTVGKMDGVDYTTSVEHGTISFETSNDSSSYFRIYLPANDTNKTYTLTFRLLINKLETKVYLYTSTSEFQIITLYSNGYGKVEGFEGGSIRHLGSSIKNLDGTIVFSEITLTEDNPNSDEFIKTDLIKHLDANNMSDEFSKTIDEKLSYNPQTLTDEQKEIARNNIDAMQSILTKIEPFDYGIKNFYTIATLISEYTGFIFTKEGEYLNISHHEISDAGRKTIIVRFSDTITKPGKTYKVIFTIDKIVTSSSIKKVTAYNNNTVLASGSIENGKAEFLVTGPVNAVSFQCDTNQIVDFNITCIVNDIEDIAHDIVDTQYLREIKYENLSDELRKDINFGVDKKQVALTISADDVIKTDGRYCHSIGSKGTRISGNGTKTITLSHNDSVADAAVMSFGLLVPWNTQNVADIKISCSDVVHKIGKAVEDIRTEMGHAYNVQGNTYNRITFLASDTDIIIDVTSEEDWVIEISDSIVLDDVYKKTPILIEYDGGTWNGEITDGEETFNQWEMHRRLNIPYGINISEIGADEAFDEYATLSVNDGIAEISLRYAGTSYYKDPEIDLVNNIDETFSTLPISTRGVVGLGQSVYDKKLLRCLKKGVVKIVRGRSANNGGTSMKGEDDELIVCDGHFMNSKTSIPLYGLPVIAWCHGVGTVPDDDPEKLYYSSGTRVLTLLKWLKQKEEGLVELLSPSEFVERLKH